jgi:hypothetical protein
MAEGGAPRRARVGAPGRREAGGRGGSWPLLLPADRLPLLGARRPAGGAPCDGAPSRPPRGSSTPPTVRRQIEAGSTGLHSWWRRPFPSPSSPSSCSPAHRRGPAVPPTPPRRHRGGDHKGVVAVPANFRVVAVLDPSSGEQQVPVARAPGRRQRRPLPLRPPTSLPPTQAIPFSLPLPAHGARGTAEVARTRWTPRQAPRPRWRSLWIPLDPEDSGADAIPPASCRSPAAGRLTPSNDGKRMAGDIPSPAVGSLITVSLVWVQSSTSIKLMNVKHNGNRQHTFPAPEQL